VWIVSVLDDETDEIIDIIVGDYKELMQILEYIKKNNLRLSLEHVEQRWFCGGLAGLKEAVGDNGNDIPDKI
jgi:hypothetical protein